MLIVNCFVEDMIWTITKVGVELEVNVRDTWRVREVFPIPTTLSRRASESRSFLNRLYTH